MSAAEEVHAVYEDFATRFLHPLLLGGTAELGRPIAPALVDDFAVARPADRELDQEIYGALHRGAAAIAPLRRVSYPDAGTMALAMAGHNLALVTDPKLDRVFARRARNEILAWHDRFLAIASAPTTRSGTLTRHVVVERLLALQRRDVVVKNWAYTYRFFGRPVPPRVVALPTIRRVKQTSETRPVVDLWDQLDDRELPGIERAKWAWVARSPVTEVLMAAELPSFRFAGANLAALSDSGIRGGVARLLVRRGLPDVASKFGEALIELRGAPGGLLYVALAFILELLLVDTLNRRASEDALASPATRSAAFFAAVLVAAVQAPGALQLLLQLEPIDHDLVVGRAQRLLRVLPEDVIKPATALIRRAFHPPADVETPL